MSPSLRRALWALLAIGFGAACILLWARVGREQRNREVELVFDYAALRDLARARGEELDLRRYQDAKSVAIAELKLDDLESQGVAVALEGLQLAIMRKTASPPDPAKSYLVFFQERSLPAIEASLQLALGEKKVRRMAGEPAILELDVDLRILPTLGLGFPAELIAELDRGGYRIWLRPENKPRADAQAVERAYQQLKALPGVVGVVFGGAPNEALGYPQGLDMAAEQLKGLGWKVGLIELMPGAQQKGIEFLVRKLPYQTVRVFAVSPAQQEKLKPDRVVGMFSLAARERNLRALYVRPYAYDPSPEKGMENANDELFQGLHDELKGTLGAASVFEESGAWKPDPLLLAIVAAGAGAASWLLLDLLLPLPLWVGGALMGGLTVLTALTALAGPGQLWRTLMALGTGCVIPSLAMVSHFGYLDRVGKSPGRGGLLLGSLLLLARVSALSLGGALMAASYLGETTFMLGLDTFRGVKLLTLGVPVLVVLAWLVRERVVLPWLNTPLRLYHVAILAVLGVVAIFYTMRTGNMAGDAGGEALEYEKQLRLILDQVLGVRPRFKEFMVGHPALVLCPVVVWLRLRPLLPLMLLVAAIGQAGMADTFAHIHTPVQVSLIRSILGVVLGGLAGTVFAGLVLLVAALVARRVSIDSNA